MTRSRTAVNASFVVTSLPGFFRLGKCCLLFKCVFLEFLHVACILKSRDVKRSSEIQTSNETCEFWFVFQLFDIRLLTAFYWMPLCVFDYECVDCSIRICMGCCCGVRSRNCDRTFLLAVAGSRGWHVRDLGDRCRRVGMTWVGTRGRWNREIMPPIVGSRPSDHYFRSVCWFVCLSVCLFVCLCRAFLSRLLSDFDQTWTYVTCLVLLCPLEYRGWVTPKKLVFLGILGLRKLSRPTVLIGLSWFLVIL